MNLLSWFRDFIVYLKSTDYLVKEQALNDTSLLYELYTTIILPSNAIIWRVTAVCVIKSHDSDTISQIDQTFFEYAYQMNVTRQILFADKPASDNLRQFLDQHNIIFIELNESLLRTTDSNLLYQELARILFPAISEDDITEIISSDTGDEPPADVEKKQFVQDLLYESLEFNAVALRLLIYYFTIPDQKDKQTTAHFVSIDDCKMCIAYLDFHDEIARAFLYPNRFYLNLVIHKSRQILYKLKSIVIPSDLEEVVKALRALQLSLIHLSLNLLYGSDISYSLEMQWETLKALSHEHCLSLLVEDLECRDIEAQLFLIGVITQLNIDSELVLNTLLKGAQSNIKPLAVRCISILGNFGLQSAVPVLQELKKDRRQSVREAAEHALTKLRLSKKPLDRFQPIPFPGKESSLKSDVEKMESIVKEFDDASCNSFFIGPKDTLIHLRIMNADSNMCLATTYHPEGAFDVSVGKKPGMLSSITGRLTGTIQPSPDRECKMGEFIIDDGHGNVTKGDLSEGDDSDE